MGGDGARRLLLPLAGPVAERTVRWYVARLKAAAAPKEVYVHRSPWPGVTLEVDFGESWAEVAGVLRKVKYVVATLPYSNVYFAKAYPIERLESLLDGIQAAFAYMGGVTDRVVLDNTTIAVKQVLTGRDREQTDAFQAFRGAYPFAAAFCAPAKGWEKGSVETGVKYVRNLVFRPRPTVATWAALNALIITELEADLATRPCRCRSLVTLPVLFDDPQRLALQAQSDELNQPLVAIRVELRPAGRARALPLLLVSADVQPDKRSQHHVIDGWVQALHPRDRIGEGPWFNAAGLQIAANVDDLQYNNSNVNYEHALNERGEALREALKSDQTESGFDSARLPGELQLLDRFNRINGAAIRSTHQLRRFRVIGGVNHVVHDPATSLLFVDRPRNDRLVAQLLLDPVDKDLCPLCVGQIEQHYANRVDPTSHESAPHPWWQREPDRSNQSAESRKAQFCDCQRACRPRVVRATSNGTRTYADRVSRMPPLSV